MEGSVFLNDEPIGQITEWAIGEVSKDMGERLAIGFSVDFSGTLDAESTEQKKLFENALPGGRMRLSFKTRGLRTILRRLSCKLFGHKLERIKLHDGISVVSCLRCRSVRIYPGMYIHCDGMEEENGMVAATFTMSPTE